MGLSTKQVSGDGFDWGQSLLNSDSLELPKTPPPPPPAAAARRQQPQQQSEPVPCPRCGSTNTKFCYYNNYNKTQPRHFCKACKRHWTKGGTLRNVPVGGGRKNKRHKKSNATAAISSSTTSGTSRSNTHIGIQKNMCEFLYQDLILPPPPAPEAHHHEYSINNENFLGSTPPFTFSSSFESNPSSISTSFRSSDAHNFTGGLDFMEDTTTTTTTVMPTTTTSIPSRPWQVLPISSGVMDMPNYWNWDDFDSLVSSTEINIPLDDDTEIKP